MPTRIGIIHRIIIAVSIEVKAVNIFGVEVSGIIGRDESSPFGRIIARVEKIPFALGIVVVAPISYGICGGKAGVKTVSLVIFPILLYSYGNALSSHRRFGR